MILQAIFAQVNLHKDFLFKVTIDETESLRGIPVDTEVFRRSSGRLETLTMSSDQTGRCQDVWKKTADLGHLEDV